MLNNHFFHSFIHSFIHTNTNIHKIPFLPFASLFHFLLNYLLAMFIHNVSCTASSVPSTIDVSKSRAPLYTELEQEKVEGVTGLFAPGFRYKVPGKEGADGAADALAKGKENGGAAAPAAEEEEEENEEPKKAKFKF